MFEGHLWGERVSVSEQTTCALCREPADVRRSHIIPEFFYRPIYDETHRFLEASTDPTDRLIIRQKGLREFLLCQGCEATLSAWESYAGRVIKGGLALRYEKDDAGFTVHGVDYAPFKLFGMSLLWRAGVCSLPEFSVVTLGRHQEKLRLLLHTANPGPAHEYGFSMVFPPDAQAQELFSHAIAPPQVARYRAHRVYRFLLGVTVWLFPVSNHMSELEDGIISLREDGTLRVYNGGPQTMDFLRRFGGEIADAAAARPTESLRRRARQLTRSPKAVRPSELIRGVRRTTGEGVAV